MILNTGQRTDIPAFYWPWFQHRLQEGFVLVRNPYYPKLVSRIPIDPEVTDLIAFCTKNPLPALENMELLQPYRQYWFVTITPYGRDIEPSVPDKWKMMDSFRSLSRTIGKRNICWRYDPVFITERYSVSYHLRAFETMCSYLSGYTEYCVISFIDLYEKTKKNFPEVRELREDEIALIGERFSAIAHKHDIRIRTCMEQHDLERYGIDTRGCFTEDIAEQCLQERLHVPSGARARQGCSCLLGGDIGAYNSCGHGCIYCYANENQTLVKENMKCHDPSSPLLIGHLHEDDIVRDAHVKSWKDPQLQLNLM